MTAEAKQKVRRS